MWIAILLVAGFVLSGVGVIAGGIVIDGKQKRFQKKALHTRAKVVEFLYDLQLQNNKLEKVAAVVVEVDRNGEKLRMRSAVTYPKSSLKFKSGSTIPICYDPKQPDSFQIVGLEQDRSTMRLCFIIGGSFIAVGLYLLYGYFNW